MRDTSTDSFFNFLCLLSILVAILSECAQQAGYWETIETAAQLMIWLGFGTALAKGFMNRRAAFVKTHVREIFIFCASLPVGHLELTAIRYYSFDVLHLLGLIAAASRVIGWSKSKFATTPLVVIVVAGILHTLLSSALLRKLEPSTFKTLPDAIWYVIVTISTIGYGDLVPQSVPGRAVAVFVMLIGVTIAGIFIGFVAESVHQHLETNAGASSVRSRLEALESEVKEISMLCGRIHVLLNSQQMSDSRDHAPVDLAETNDPD